MPLRIVRSEMPVALATTVMPPRPKDMASTADHRRRASSLRSHARASNLHRIHSTIVVSVTRHGMTQNACSDQYDSRQFISGRRLSADRRWRTRQSGVIGPQAVLVFIGQYAALQGLVGKVIVFRRRLFNESGSPQHKAELEKSIKLRELVLKTMAKIQNNKE